LEVKCASPTGDTIIKINIDQNTNTFVIPCGKFITGLNADPNNWLLNASKSFVKDSNLIALNIKDLQVLNSIRLFPNPCHEFITIENKSSIELNVSLRDLSGRILWSNKINQSINVPTTHFAKGIYLLELNNGHSKRNEKIVVE
jgi:hypothetical protein